LEIEATKETCRLDNVVIACGGGIILNQINIDRLKQSSVVVYLSADPDRLIKRVMGTQTVRPLLDVEDMKKHICTLLEIRIPLYERAADITVDTTEMDVATTVELVMKELHNNDSFSF
jgi:shikimate kinase